jgi:hypothetical protein
MRVFYVWRMSVLVGYELMMLITLKKKRVGKKQEENNMYNF